MQLRRAKWNEKRVDDAVPVWREKNPRKAKKFKFISHIVRVVCAVQMPGVSTILCPLRAILIGILGHKSW